MLPITDYRPQGAGSKVLSMGMAYKENVADTRESPAVGIVEGHRELGVDPAGALCVYFGYGGGGCCEADV